MPPAAMIQPSLSVDVIKQHPGPQSAARHVKVMVPGKFFPQLQPAERAVNYEGEAVEFKEKHTFSRHAQGWGAAALPSSARTCAKSKSPCRRLGDSTAPNLRVRTLHLDYNTCMRPKNKLRARMVEKV